MLKYFFESNGVKSEVTEDTFNTVREYYDESNISATGDSYGNEEIVLYVDEVNMP